MTTDYPITATQFALVRRAERNVQLAQHALLTTYEHILAAHDAPIGHITQVTERTITVETPDAPPVALPEDAR